MPSPRERLQAAILRRREWMVTLAELEDADIARLRTLLDKYSEEIVRLVGVHTDKAVAVRAERLATIDKAMEDELARLIAEARDLHARTFKAVVDQAITNDLRVYRVISRRIAAKMEANLAAFQRNNLPGIWQLSYDEWLDEVENVGGNLLKRMRRELQLAELDGIGQNELAARIARNPQFQHENLPELARSPERIFGGRLGTNDALRYRAQRIVRAMHAQVVNRSHERWTQAAGFELYISINPLDERTTQICLDAARQQAMPLEEWDESIWGRAPRGEHFGNCRSLNMAVPSDMKHLTGEPVGFKVVEREINGKPRLVVEGKRR